MPRLLRLLLRASTHVGVVCASGSRRYDRFHDRAFGAGWRDRYQAEAAGHLGLGYLFSSRDAIADHLRNEVRVWEDLNLDGFCEVMLLREDLTPIFWVRCGTGSRIQAFRLRPEELGELRFRVPEVAGLLVELDASAAADAMQHYRPLEWTARNAPSGAPS